MIQPCHRIVSSNKYHRESNGIVHALFLPLVQPWVYDDDAGFLVIYAVDVFRKFLLENVWRLTCESYHPFYLFIAHSPVDGDASVVYWGMFQQASSLSDSACLLGSWFAANVRSPELILRRTA